MQQLIEGALTQATIGQLAMAISQRLANNTEVKIKASWVRVQHRVHCDRLHSAQSIDAAIAANLA